MKIIKPIRLGWLSGTMALAGVLLASAPVAHAYVYASNIKINGSLTNGPVPAAQGGSVSISYILNEAASNGVSISIFTNTTVIDTIGITYPAAGTQRGLNTVVWGTTNSDGTPTQVGNYTISITAATRGYTVWTQTSIDTNAGMPAHYPLGIDVDKNTNSVYYGRVVMGCALHTGTTNVPAAAMQTGLFKMNADGSQADEGWYGNANYLEDDKGDAPVAGQMPDSGGYDPMKIRISDDDRIYWVDNSDVGAVIACDMQATTNQIVINQTGYSSSPFDADLGTVGFQVFDVAFTSTTNASVWLGDNNYPSSGYWMFHMTNGAADPNDYYGTQVVATGGDLAIVSSSGCTVDTNLDFFCGQARNNENAFYDAMVFPNWNGGVLPPENGVGNYAMGSTAGQVTWGYGCGVDSTCATDPSFESSEDTVINSRTSPTIVACSMGEGSQFSLGKTGGGIRLLNAQTGALITVTNGATITTYSNLDNGEAYPCAAWDNVGNLYGASTTRNLWRVYSPPGGSTNTTVALEVMSLQPLPVSASLTTTTFSGKADGNATQITATINGTAPLTLQWYSIDTTGDTNPVAGQVINTAATSTLALSNLMDSQNGYQYFLVASNAYGPAVTTSVATLTIINPTVSLSATTFSGDANGNATTITASTNGVVAPSLQWYSIDLSNDTNAVPGQTNATLALTNLQASQNGYQYFVVGSWTYAPSVTSSVATLTVYNLPVITTDITPLLEYVPTGYTDSFTVAATGALPLFYQWYSNGIAVSGATNAQFTLNAANGTTKVYANVANSVDPSGVNSSTATVIAPSTALSFASTVGVNSSAGWDLNGGAIFASPGVLQLTTAAGSEARSAFYALGKLPINGFVATFTYIDPTKGGADGITFCLQGVGPTKVGGAGGSLGVSTITPSAELEFNVYAANTVGIAYATDGSIAKDVATGSVNLASGDPINVTIVYNNQASSMYVKLLDTTTLATYSTTYSGGSSNNITNVIGGNTAWVGFTGATGGSDASQQVSNFLYQSLTNEVLAAGSLTGGTLPLAWIPASATLYQSPSLQGPWTLVGGTVTTNIVTGQASTTVTPTGPTQFFSISPP